MLQIVTIVDYMQCQGKLMNQTLRNDKYLGLGPILVTLAQVWAPKILYLWILSLLDVRH